MKEHVNIGHDAILGCGRRRVEARWEGSTSCTILRQCSKNINRSVAEITAGCKARWLHTDSIHDSAMYGETTQRLADGLTTGMALALGMVTTETPYHTDKSTPVVRRGRKARSLQFTGDRPVAESDPAT
jgi:hypothetical protein